MEKTFTEEQMKELSVWEPNMRTAVRSNWARGIGSTAARRMNEIYNAATGAKGTVNASCAGCMLNLLRDVGRLYFAQKDAKESEKESAGTKVKRAKKSERNGK